MQVKITYIHKILKGKYILSTTHHLLKTTNISISGVGVGNGWVVPSIQYKSYPKYLLQNNIISSSVFHQSKKYLRKCLQRDFISIQGNNNCQNYSNYLTSYGKYNFNWYNIDKVCYGSDCYVTHYIKWFLDQNQTQRILGVDE